MIHSYAVDIVKKLVREGYTAYFAGGWVRDYIMGRPSDDIDIATSATPEQIMDLFPRTLLVGLQFGVVIVLVDGHQYEVSTFRKDLEYTNGRKPGKIIHTDAKEDALRRDFTINGMFYDPLEDQIHDFVGGREDIQKGIIRTIGDPQERFFEDRLRMIRAFRFASRFNFIIDLETQEAIRENSLLLFPAVAMERIWQEFTKMSSAPHFDRALIDMHKLGLLPVIFPEIKSMHLHELEKRVKPLSKYPLKVPPTLFLKELFHDFSIDQLELLARYLKASNKEIDFLLFYAKHFPFDISHSPLANAKFYAHPYAQTCLNVYAARLMENDKKVFFEHHMNEEKRLSSHIQRIKENKPLVNSNDLLQAGIPPGKVMGELLKLGEKIAVENDLEDSLAVLEQLKQTKFWPK